MVEAALYMDAVIGFALSRSNKEEVHLRLDDTIEGVGMLATELLNRTEGIRDLASRVAPAIELHNHNPLEQIFNAIRAFKSGDFSNFSDAGSNINPREPDGRYGTREEIETEVSPETIDVID